MLHDAASAPAAAAAAASILGSAPSNADASSPPSLLAVPSDIEVDQSGEASTPIRAVEAVTQLAPALAQQIVKRTSSSNVRSSNAATAHPILLAVPSELPAMPLVIAASWSHNLPAFSLPMLLQLKSPILPWQTSLASSLHEQQQAARSGEGAGSGRERWINQATELILQVLSEASFGGSSSVEFHDISLIRCDARRMGTKREVPYNSTLMYAQPSVSALRRHLQLGLLESAMRRQQVGSLTSAAGAGPLGADQLNDLLGGETSEQSSYSYTTSAMMRCPESGFDLQPIRQPADDGSNQEPQAAAASPPPAEAKVPPGSLLSKMKSSKSTGKSRSKKHKL